MDIDDVDKGIIYLLQQNARHITTQEMGDKVEVSASTVRNRIEKMEERGIIRGYHPDIDYNEAGLELHMLFICRTPNPERARLAKQARDIDGIVAIHEVLNGEDNVQVEAVGTDTDDLARINDELSEFGLQVVNSKVLKSSYLKPFNHFGEQIATEETND